MPTARQRDDKPTPSIRPRAVTVALPVEEPAPAGPTARAYRALVNFDAFEQYQVYDLEPDGRTLALVAMSYLEEV
jgi:hypothetical protein